MVRKVIKDGADEDPELALSALAELDPEQRLVGRNRTKADLLFYRLGERRIALKTYAARPFVVRNLLGRWLIGREVSAYQAAGRTPGLPRFLGRVGPYSLATDWVSARSLAADPAPSVGPATLDRLEGIVAELHRSGIAVADLHRGDVLVDGNQKVYLVDLAAAWTIGDGSGRIRRAIFERLCGLDRIALARIRAHSLGTVPDSGFEAVGGPAARWYRWGRRLKEIWDRLRGRHRS